MPIPLAKVSDDLTHRKPKNSFNPKKKTMRIQLLALMQPVDLNYILRKNANMLINKLNVLVPGLYTCQSIKPIDNLRVNGNQLTGYIAAR